MRFKNSVFLNMKDCLKAAEEEHKTKTNLGLSDQDKKKERKVI